MGEGTRYRYDDRDDRRRNRSETPVALIVSLAVGIPAALAVLFVIVMLVNQEPDFELQPVVRNEPIFAPKPPDAPRANPMLVANALPQPAPPRGIPGKRMIDLIPLIDPGQDAVHGRWAVADNVLHCNDGSFVPRIKIPYRPPEEYDFIVTFSQPGLRNGISLAAGGVAIGMVVALAAAPLMRSLLNGMSPRDPLIFVTISLILLTATSVASWIPAHRATRVDPNAALRCE